MAPEITFQEVDNYGDATGTNSSWSPKFNVKNDYFVKMFTVPGTYYYSTGYVDMFETMWLSGMVIVEPAVERAEEIEVLVTDVFRFNFYLSRDPRVIFLSFFTRLIYILTIYI